jgi:hypothetical protein
MAKTTAPLLSFDGKGQIGKTMVASKWRGVKYMRQYVVPANPNTVAQQRVRSIFALLREAWKLAPPGVTAAWNAFASGRPFTGMNKWVGENVRVLNNESDMDNIIFSPGAGGGLPPATASVTDGTAGQVIVTGTAPTAPSGWVFKALAAAAFPDQDPTGIFSGPFIYGEDDTTPFSVTLAGFATGAALQVGVWAVWTKPNGALAYSVGQTFHVTAG